MTKQTKIIEASLAYYMVPKELFDKYKTAIEGLETQCKEIAMNKDVLDEAKIRDLNYHFGRIKERTYDFGRSLIDKYLTSNQTKATP